MFYYKNNCIYVYFQIVELICNGAFGKVYRVKQLDSNYKLYAMKILEKSSVTIFNLKFILCLRISNSRFNLIWIFIQVVYNLIY